MLLGLLGMGSVATFSGCAQLEKGKASPETLAPEMVEMQSGFVKARVSTPVEEVLTYASMDAQTMYQLMIAELLVSREQFLEAFDLMIPIAEERREKEITQRVFQLSMQSFNLQAMKRATNLLKSVEPEKSTTWQASYLLALQEGSLEVAFTDWQKYSALAQQDQQVDKTDATVSEDSLTIATLTNFERLVLDTANRVVRMVSAEKGLAFLQMIQKAYSNEKVTDYAMGAAALSYQENEIALSALWQAEKRYLGSPQLAVYEDIYIKLSQAYLAQGAYVEGLSKLASYMEKYPENWRFQEQYARLEVKAERNADAIQRYTQIIQKAPQAHTSRLSLALLLMDQKQYVAADALLNPLLGVPGYQSISLYYSGVSKKAQQQPEQALLFFKQIFEGEFFIEAQIQIAELEYAVIGWQKTLAKLAALTPSNPEDQLKLFRAEAIFYKAAGDYVNAIDRYEQAIQIMPSNLDLLFAQAVLFYEIEDFSHYEDRLERILTLSANQVDALNALGYYYVEQNVNLDKAEMLLSKAYELAPESYYVLDSLGWLRYAQANYQAAEILLEKALVLQLDEEVLTHLIKTKWQLNKRAEAEALWHKYVHSFPESKHFPSLIENLSKN